MPLIDPRDLLITAIEGALDSYFIDTGQDKDHNAYSQKIAEMVDELIESTND